MQPGPAESSPKSESSSRQASLGRSVLKRAVIGLVLLFIIVSGGAWLMHAGIQAEAEPAGEEASLSEPADRTR